MSPAAVAHLARIRVLHEKLTGIMMLLIDDTYLPKTGAHLSASSENGCRLVRTIIPLNSEREQSTCCLWLHKQVISSPNLLTREYLVSSQGLVHARRNAPAKCRKHQAARPLIVPPIVVKSTTFRTGQCFDCAWAGQQRAGSAWTKLNSVKGFRTTTTTKAAFGFIIVDMEPQ